MSNCLKELFRDRQDKYIYANNLSWLYFIATTAHCQSSFLYTFHGKLSYFVNHSAKKIRITFSGNCLLQNTLSPRVCLREKKTENLYCVSETRIEDLLTKRPQRGREALCYWPYYKYWIIFYSFLKIFIFRTKALPSIILDIPLCTIFFTDIPPFH